MNPTSSSVIVPSDAIIKAYLVEMGREDTSTSSFNSFHPTRCGREGGAYIGLVELYSSTSSSDQHLEISSLTEEPAQQRPSIRSNNQENDSDYKPSPVRSRRAIGSRYRRYREEMELAARLSHYCS